MNKMEDRKKIDFKRHTLPPVSRWYLWRIIFYVVLLIVVSAIIYATMDMRKGVKPDEIKEIDGINLELEDS